MLTFAHPWMFWLLPLPIMIWWSLPARVRSQPAVRVPFLHRIREAKEGTSSLKANSQTQRLFFQSIQWISILIALARPQLLEPPISREIPTRDLLLTVDLSASMDKEDFTNSEGKLVDRLTALKEVLGEFLLQRQGDRVGLVVFGNSPFLQAPFTTDLELCEQLLEGVDVGMAGPKTALGDAIGLGINLFDESTAPEKTIITLTDGNDTSSAVPPVEAARIAKDRGITIYTIAMGDPETVGEEKLDEEALKEVAKVTGGEYFLAMDRSELEGIYQRLDEIETQEIKTVSHRPRRDLYFFPLITALLLSLTVNVVRLLKSRSKDLTQKSNARVRVNPRTFELEVTQS